MVTEAKNGDAVIETTVTYARRGDIALSGTIYRPPGDGPFPAVIAVHGGGWRLSPPGNYKHLGRWLAASGTLVFAPTYRLATPGASSWPDAVHDVRAAVQYLRAEAGSLGIDPERLALMGDSSGAHLAALVGLAGDAPPYADSGANGPMEEWPTQVKAVIAVYGIFDLAAQWQHDQSVRFADHIVERFLGVGLPADRRPYFEASPISFITSRNNRTAFLVAWGTHDDVVDPATQSEAFVLALKQAGHFVRTVPVIGAPHYWIADPLDEPMSHSGYFAARLERFLKARL